MKFHIMTLNKISMKQNNKFSFLCLHIFYKIRFTHINFLNQQHKHSKFFQSPISRSARNGKFLIYRSISISLDPSNANGENALIQTGQNALYLQDSVSPLAVWYLAKPATAGTTSPPACMCTRAFLLSWSASSERFTLWDICMVIYPRRPVVGGIRRTWPTHTRRHHSI